jgi:predicted Co/Zn/Cd cation transporter (cation efflux family)
MYFLPFMSHAHSVFTCSLLVWFWRRTFDQRVATDDLTNSHLRSWFLLGLLSALAFITYYPNLLLSLFVLADFAELTYRGSPSQLGYGEPWWFFDPRL